MLLNQFQSHKKLHCNLLQGCNVTYATVRNANELLFSVIAYNYTINKLEEATLTRLQTPMPVQQYFCEP